MASKGIKGLINLSFCLTFLFPKSKPEILVAC